MNWWKLTGWILAFVTLGLIGYDIAARVSGTNSTISEWIHFYSGKYPLLPAAIGGLVIHLLGAETRN